jgi:hypothetical protein
MKTFHKFFLVLAILAVTMLAFMPAIVHAASPAAVLLPADVLNVVVTIMLGFASLVGVSKLIAALVNVLKVCQLVKDNTADKWAAGLNLAAFIALVAFGVFRPDLATNILNGYAGQIAMVILFVLGFIMQITGSKPAHDALSAASVPLIGKSYSKDA